MTARRVGVLDRRVAVRRRRRRRCGGGSMPEQRWLPGRLPGCVRGCNTWAAAHRATSTCGGGIASPRAFAGGAGGGAAGCGSGGGDGTVAAFAGTYTQRVPPQEATSFCSCSSQGVEACWRKRGGNRVRARERSSLGASSAATWPPCPSRAASSAGLAEGTHAIQSHTCTRTYKVLRAITTASAAQTRERSPTAHGGGGKLPRYRPRRRSGSSADQRVVTGRRPLSRVPAPNASRHGRRRASAPAPRRASKRDGGKEAESRPCSRRRHR